MVNYCTNDDILDKVGVTTTELSTDTLDRIAKEATAEVDRLLKTTCNPKEEFLITKGNNKNSILVKDTPLLVVKNIRIDDTDINMETAEYYKTGEIRLLKTAEIQYFYSKDESNVKIKYVYGWLEESNKKTTQDDVLKGNSVDIELEDVLLLKEKEWVKITGIDGYSEWTQINSINTTNKTINCDLLYDHVAGSTVYRGTIPQIVQKLTAVIGGIMGAIHMMGSTYTFATSYSVPDYSVTKGVPYPHFVKVMDDLTKQRDNLLGQLIPYPIFA